MMENLTNKELETILLSLFYLIEDLELQEEKGHPQLVLNNDEKLLDNAKAIYSKLSAQHPKIEKKDYIWPAFNYDEIKPIE
ncbi:hypothetical protein [Sphingobacterium kitahiroshimense]|uniref:hypothetical protein n=1 Tax=Sphingobacterium kitahiroshimense TaxID=470446 RepID=UPI00320A294D